MRSDRWLWHRWSAVASIRVTLYGCSLRTAKLKMERKILFKEKQSDKGFGTWWRCSNGTRNGRTSKPSTVATWTVSVEWALRTKKKKTISITVIQKKISIKEGCLNHGKIYIFELFCIMIIFGDANEIGKMVLDYRWLWWWYKIFMI